MEQVHEITWNLQEIRKSEFDFFKKLRQFPSIAPSLRFQN